MVRVAPFFDSRCINLFNLPRLNQNARTVWRSFSTAFLKYTYSHVITVAIFVDVVVESIAFLA